MAEVLKYLPGFVDDCDEDYIPVQVNSFDEIVSIEWIAKWSKSPGFKCGMWSAGSSYLSEKLFTSDPSQHGCLWVQVDFSKQPLLIAFVSDVSLIKNLPERTV